MRNNLKKNILLLLITLIIVFGIGEVIIRVYFNATGKTIGVDEEDVCNRRAYEAALGTNIETGRHQVSYPPHYEWSAQTGVWPRKNYDGNQIITHENTTIVLHQHNTNDQRMRGLRNYPLQNYNNTIRIALFGDSFTWGADVPLLYSYPAFLEKLAQGTETLNFGIEGTGIDIMYLRWIHEGIAFQPDIVVFNIFLDDIRRAFPCIHKPRLKLKEGEIFLIEGLTGNQIVRAYRKPFIESYLIKNIIYNLHYLKGVEETQYEENYAVTEAILDTVNAWSKETDTYFMVVIIEGGNDWIPRPVDKRVLSWLESTLKKKKIPFTSTERIFKEKGYVAKDPGVGIGHFTPLGYAYFAQGVKEFLEEVGELNQVANYSFSWESEANTRFIITNKNTGEEELLRPYTLIEHSQKNQTDTKSQEILSVS